MFSVEVVVKMEAVGKYAVEEYVVWVVAVEDLFG